ncbi:PIG-L deacetylase family protein [Pseudomonas matsuisoli]|uniref:Acetylglucosaminylphosphatidylinositol deacetylase n=1 Tax=Pseudomonas matsuisoli TaxID=1515666 RepID=A0A917PTE8_9PSED|nr:PIG-L family deacetylase [Pseudomonas matsuisoli]GGJ91738.1 acetylglucosaminylphosphatidylinositol deacetylase [Pseudomonas matsuisoli]
MASVGSRQIVGEGTSYRDWASWNGFDTMLRLDVANLIEPGSRAIIVAPHPDDEVLGCGGLMQALAALKRQTLLVAVTDGGGSHPGSKQWPQEKLLENRPTETLDALSRLDIDLPAVHRLGIPDGGVAQGESELIKKLLALIEPGDTVFATWEFDGHPDHEATGRAARRACELTGTRCVQVPVWTWHWARPGDPRVPWQHARRLDLDDKALERKRHAMTAFESQIHPDPSTGAEPILSPDALERLFRPWEIYFV